MVPIAAATLLEMTVSTIPLGNTAIITSLITTALVIHSETTAITTSLEMPATTTPSGIAAITTSLETTAPTTPSEMNVNPTPSETTVNRLNSHQIKMPQQNTTIIDITALGMDANTSYLKVQKQHPHPLKYRTITSPKGLIVGIRHTNILMQKEIFHMKQGY